MYLLDGLRYSNSSMKHYLEVDIGLSQPAKHFDLGWPWRCHFKIMKVNIQCSGLAVAHRPKVQHVDNMFTVAHIMFVDPEWPLGVIWMSQMWKSPIFLMVWDRHLVSGYHETLMESRYRTFKICTQIWSSFNLMTLPSKKIAMSRPS